MSTVIIGETSPLLWASAVLMIFIVHRIIVYPLFFSPLRLLPQANVSWYQRLIGWIYIEPNARELLDFYEDHATNVGLLGYPGGGNMQRVLVVDPTALKELTTTQCYSRFRKPLRLVELLGFTSGYGLLTADGLTHKEMKKKVLTAFTASRIQSVSPIFWTKANELADNLQRRIDDQRKGFSDKTTPAQLDIAFDVSLATLDVIGVAAWGLDFNALRDPNSDFMHEFRGMFPRSRFEVFLLSLGFYFPIEVAQKLPFRRYLDFKRFTATLRAKCRYAIAQKKDSVDLETKPDFLSVMMALDIFNDEQLVEQLLTLLMAGHDATGTMIVWTLLELGSNTAVQSRLRAELREHIQLSDWPDEVGNHFLEKMPYLQAVINETIRLHPTAPKIAREATVDTELCGHAIPKGTQLLIAPLVCNLSKQAWGSDAREFNPDRWLQRDELGTPENSAYSFMTFNKGPRHCIGEKFAESEISAVIACLVSRFEFESAMGDYGVFFGMTMRPMGGLKLRIRPTEGQVMPQ